MNRFFGVSVLFLCISPLISGQVRNLDFYLKEGLSGSPLIKDYANQFGSVRFDSLLVRAGKKPQIEARSTLQFLPAYERFGYDEVITDKGSYQAMVGVSQDIFGRREVNNRLDALNIRRKSLTNTTRISSNELTRLITDQYLASVSAFSDLSFNKTFLDLLYNENEIVKQLASKGI
jgi:hypothetical protein